MTGCTAAPCAAPRRIGWRGSTPPRAFTLRYDTLLSVGRVQTPYPGHSGQAPSGDRHLQARRFLHLSTASFVDYEGQWFREGLDPDTHIPHKAQAQAIAAQVQGQTGRVLSAETTRRREPPPQLYDLTSLQRGQPTAT